MKRPFSHRCGHTPGTLTPEDQAAVDVFCAHLAAIGALRSPEPWTPGHCQDVALRVGPASSGAHPVR
jgi:hypothetical protein